MRTDFREERRWKLALAYNLSTSVLEWHALSSWDERVAYGVCVKWKPVKEDGREDVEMDDQIDSANAALDEPPTLQRHDSMLAVDYASDDDDEDMESDEIETKDLIDPLAPRNELEDAMEVTRQSREEEQLLQKESEGPNVEPKREEVDDASALRMIEADLIKISQTAVPEPDLSGLKSTSKDPVLGSKSSSHSLNGDAEDSKANANKVKISAYAPTREKIAYGSDKLFLTPEDLDSFVRPEQADADKGESDLYHSLGLSTLFPELQPYGMLDVAPAVVLDPTKKRSSRSNDKDDPNKRIDELNYTKVMPAGKFMTLKPTLLVPLEPATHWKDGKWLPMEEFAVPADSESNGKITEECLSG